MKSKKIWIVAVILLAILAAAAAVNLFLVGWHVEIRLTGGDMTVECGDTFTDPGAAATYGGSRFFTDYKEIPVTVTGSVESAVPGDYTITYQAESNVWGITHAETKTRNVHVVDTTAPELTLKSIPGYYTLPGHPYEEEGFTCMDIADGDLTAQVEIIEKDGFVYYTVSDKSGNTATAQREIHYDDPVAPEITLIGGTELTWIGGYEFVDPGFTAADNLDGDVTEKVIVEGTVDHYTRGDYTITYTVTDTYGNTATVQRIVTVVAPRQADNPESTGKVIYLTFDDGPGSYTSELLDILKEYNVKVTFFVVNTGRDDLIAREAAEGHTVGVHSASHVYESIYASEDNFWNDFYYMANIIANDTGSMPWVSRFPGGSSNMVSSFNKGIMLRLARQVLGAGFQYYDWNVDSGDAVGASTPEEVFNNVVDGVTGKSVAVVLQHDIKSFSVAAVEKILMWGMANGYIFLPLTPDSPVIHHGIQNA